MPTQVRSLVVGGTSGIGREIARALAARGEELVITGRELARAQTAAAELGDRHRGLALDLSQPQEVASRLAEVAGPIDHLVLSAVERGSERRAQLRHRTRHEGDHAQGGRLHRRRPCACAAARLRRVDRFVAGFLLLCCSNSKFHAETYRRSSGKLSHLTEARAYLRSLRRRTCGLIINRDIP